MSVKPAPVTGALFGFVSVMVRSELPLTLIWVGAKTFVIVGRASTLRVAEAPEEKPSDSGGEMKSNAFSEDSKLIAAFFAASTNWMRYLPDSSCSL